MGFNISDINNKNILSQIGAPPHQKKSAPRESIELLQICEWLKREYPDVLFVCEQIGMKLPKQMAIRHSKMRSPKWPDLFIACPVDGYFGIFIEYKAEGVEIKTKDGSRLLKNEHVEGQVGMIMRLRKLGYYAGICVGIDNAKAVIKNMLDKRVF